MRRYIGFLLLTVGACGQNAAKQDAVKISSEISQAIGGGLPSLGAPSRDVSFSVNCKSSGSVALSLSGQTPTSGSITFTYTATFSKCNIDGKNVIDGTLTAQFAISGSCTKTSTATCNESVAIAYNGTVTVTGDINTSLTYKNLSYSLDLAAAKSATSASVSITTTINGEVDSTENGVTNKLTFNNEKWHWDGSVATPM